MENPIVINILQRNLDIRKNLSVLFDETADSLEYGWSRWQDEREYEDINDYAQLFTKAIEKSGFQLIKMTKRPFGFIVNPKPEVTIQYYCNGRNAGYKQIDK